MEKAVDNVEKSMFSTSNAEFYPGSPGQIFHFFAPKHPLGGYKIIVLRKRKLLKTTSCFLPKMFEFLDRVLEKTGALSAAGQEFLWKIPKGFSVSFGGKWRYW